MYSSFNEMSSGHVVLVLVLFPPFRSSGDDACCHAVLVGPSLHGPRRGQHWLREVYFPRALQQVPRWGQPISKLLWSSLGCCMLNPILCSNQRWMYSRSRCPSGKMWRATTSCNWCTTTPRGGVWPFRATYRKDDWVMVYTGFLLLDHDFYLFFSSFKTA